MCVTLTDRGWDPLPCDSSLPFVCEKARRGWATTTTTTPTSAVVDTANSTLPCPSGWTGFNDYCYKVSTDFLNLAREISGYYFI